MDAITLTRLAMADSRIKIGFGGVYAKDRLPYSKKHFRSFIVNTDLSTAPGEHWQAIFFEPNGKASFFCSYGRPPCDYVNKFIMRNSKCMSYNRCQFQHWNSRTCGLFCLYFLWHKSRGLKINRLHATDTCANERLLEVFTQRHFRRVSEVKVNFKNQNCKPLTF